MPFDSPTIEHANAALVLLRWADDGDLAVAARARTPSGGAVTALVTSADGRFVAAAELLRGVAVFQVGDGALLAVVAVSTATGLVSALCFLEGGEDEDEDAGLQGKLRLVAADAAEPPALCLLEGGGGGGGGGALAVYGGGGAGEGAAPPRPVAALRAVTTWPARQVVAALVPGALGGGFEDEGCVAVGGGGAVAVVASGRAG